MSNIIWIKSVKKNEESKKNARTLDREKMEAGLQSKGVYVNSDRLARYGEAMEEDYGEMGVEQGYASLLNADLRKVCSFEFFSSC